MTLQLFQQFTGMNVIMYVSLVSPVPYLIWANIECVRASTHYVYHCRYYSTSIFCKINVASYVSTAIVGTINFLTTILAVFLVDKVRVCVCVSSFKAACVMVHPSHTQVGRKPLRLMGAVGMCVSMVAAATLILAFRVDEGENKAVGYVVVLLSSSARTICAYRGGYVPLAVKRSQLVIAVFLRTVPEHGW